MGEKQQLVEVYELDKTNPYLVLKMGFANDSILNPQVAKALKGKGIHTIELVYTNYRAAPGFNQPDLNYKRLTNLYKLAPWIFDQTNIKWVFVAQTKCGNSDECSKLFHGFVIHFQQPVTKESAKKTGDYLDKNFKPEPVDTTEELIKKRIVVNYYYMPKSKRKQQLGITYKRKGIWNRKRKNEYDTLFRYNKKVVYDYPFKYYMDKYKSFDDSVVMAVLNRNTSWNKMNVVLDVTGSMGSYLLQVLAWASFDEHQKRVSRWVFFNDGDMRPDMNKPPGNTGGIYQSSPKTAEEVFKEMRKAMNKGNGGGDIPENDIEALFKAQDYCKDCSELVLIADNLSNCRDFQLVSRIKKPVHIILCGTQTGVNTQYLELALKTGGSVHTLEQDIVGFSQLKEGQTITVGLQKFLLKDGIFVLTR